MIQPDPIAANDDDDCDDAAVTGNVNVIALLVVPVLVIARSQPANTRFPAMPYQPSVTVFDTVTDWTTVGVHVRISEKWVSLFANPFHMVALRVCPAVRVVGVVNAVISSRR